MVSVQQITDTLAGVDEAPTDGCPLPLAEVSNVVPKI